MTPALDEYAAWKATAAAELERLHEVRVATIPDRVWKRLYVAGLLPLEAVGDVVEVQAVPVGGRLRAARVKRV
jgi:hypothetical protein